MIVRTKGGITDLSQLTDKLYPIGRFTVHPKLEGGHKLLIGKWVLSHTETGTSLGDFNSKADAFGCAHTLESLRWPDNIFDLKGNRAFRRATTAIIKYHNGTPTAKEEA